MSRALSKDEIFDALENDEMFNPTPLTNDQLAKLREAAAKKGAPLTDAEVDKALGRSTPKIAHGIRIIG